MTKRRACQNYLDCHGLIPNWAGARTRYCLNCQVKNITEAYKKRKPK